MNVLPTNCRFIQQIAETPLVPVQLSGQSGRIWCKLEFLNPSGSTKDRIARYILEKQWRSGNLKAGDKVIEASSGSAMGTSTTSTLSATASARACLALSMVSRACLHASRCPV